MRRILYFSLFFPLFSYAISHSEVKWDNDKPIEVKAYNSRKVFGLAEVEVVSLVDSIRIENVRLNQGECKLDSYALVPPVTLSRNQNATFEAYSCNLKEVEIQTNLGTWINNQFTPNQAGDYDISEYCEECEDDLNAWINNQLEEDYSLYQSFYIDGRTIDLLKSPAYGMSCPNGQFVFRENGNLTEPFGTCSEELHIQQKSNKIVVTMSGYQYVDAGSDVAEIKAAEKVSEQIWQYTYGNQKLEEKQLR